MAMPNAAVGKLFVAAEGAVAGGSGAAALCLITTFLAATIFNSMIFFSQNKPPPIFSEGVILNLVGYCEVFFARGFAGALIAAGFFTAGLRGFFAGAASGVGEVSTTNGGVVNGTYGIGVVSAGGSNLYGADTLGVVTASKG